ncbi:hypothetical protein K8I31_20250, partial [bacterium]|nr:hypothetical protein [bacterium]
MKKLFYVLPCLFLLMASVSAQEILFDFEDAAQGEQWDQIAGFWDVYEGFYTQIDDSGGPLVASTDGLGVENYTLIVQGMGLVTDADWGLAFNIQDINNHYSWQFVNGGIEFIKYVDGTRTSLFSEALPEELEVWQEFKVVATGSTFECY